MKEIVFTAIVSFLGGLFFEQSRRRERYREKVYDLVITAANKVNTAVQNLFFISTDIFRKPDMREKLVKDFHENKSALAFALTNNNLFLPWSFIDAAANVLDEAQKMIDEDDFSKSLLDSDVAIKYMTVRRYDIGLAHLVANMPHVLDSPLQRLRRKLTKPSA